jgi:hypothetical protein
MTPLGIEPSNVCVSGCHRYFDGPPEDGNLIAETYIEVTNISYFVDNSCALVGLT